MDQAHPVHAQPERNTKEDTAVIQRHSKLGVASFTMSITSAVMLFLIFVFLALLEALAPDSVKEDSQAMAVAGVLFIAFMGASVGALGLGIGGLAQKRKKKVFAILGTIISSVTVLGEVFLLLVGLASGMN